MKKVLMVLCAWALFFGMVTNSNALTFTEEYNGAQFVGEKQEFNFGFDFWYDNDDFGVVTDSNLTLTQDAVGALELWESASLYIDFYSCDILPETAKIKFIAWNDDGDTSQAFELETISGWLFGTYHYTYAFNSSQLAAFNDWGWGNVKIKAVSEWFNDNDFEINKVGMTVTTANVPELATLIFLGSGLIGLGFFNRRKFKK